MDALTLAAAVLLGCQETPLTEYKFDADPKPGQDSRISIVASPVGATGNALVLNGIDASLQLDGPQQTGTVTLWVCPLDARDGVIVSQASAWQLRTLKDGSVKLEGGKGRALQSPPKSLVPNRWVHVAVAVGKDGKGELWLNGESVGRGTLGGALDAAGAPLLVGNAPQEKSFFCGIVDELRIYGTVLGIEAVRQAVEEGIPWARPRARSPFESKFVLDSADVVVFVGGEDVVSAQQNGHLEALLARKGVVFRSMAWEGDTAYEQPRLLNFGSWRDQLSKVGAGVIVVQFGATESLQGRLALPKFEAAYDRLLQEFLESTKRIVVVSPVPFEKPADPLPNLKKKNGDLALYVDAMKRLAGAKGLLYVDLFGAKWAGPLTRDGLHLSEAGHAAVAAEIARQLGVQARQPSEELLTAIRRKNRVWTDYWRPSNWAFLNGDRIEQPSSRDHVDRRVRWFPVEVQQTFAVLRHEEAEIEKLVGAPK